VARLRKADCSGPGLRRRRRGKGFEYIDDEGRKIKAPQVLDRIAELRIPPAWEDVWICPYPLDFSAKDFRTWNATVLAAVALAVSGQATQSKAARKRAMTRAVKEVARYLGNTTPSAARRTSTRACLTASRTGSRSAVFCRRSWTRRRRTTRRSKAPSRRR
jgi:DNA topoisomerase IB